MNPLRTAVHFAMEFTRLDRLVNSSAVNQRRERWLARSSPPLDVEASNQWIGDTIAAGKAAAIGQIDGPECAALAAHLGLRQFYKYTWAAPSYSEAGLASAGIFPPTDEIYWRFCELLLNRLSHLDGFAPRLNVGETKILERCCHDTRRLAVRSFQPYFLETPWSAQLAGKRVLVIHSLDSVVRTQYARRQEIWPGRPEVLPAFQLEVARAPGGVLHNCFADWLTMLAWFEQQVEGIYRRSPFDVALIGGGPAGVPLATFVKKLGAIGIHLGSFTSALFGIHPPANIPPRELQRFFNSAWVEAEEREIPPPVFPRRP